MSRGCLAGVDRLGLVYPISGFRYMLRSHACARRGYVPFFSFQFKLSLLHQLFPGHANY